MFLIPKLTVQLFPDDGDENVNVSCTLAGASPQITEASLTNPLESTLARLKGVKNVLSNTSAGSTSIKVEADKWTDLDLLRFNMAVAIRQVYPKLPQGASYPLISVNQSKENNETDVALMSYTLNGPGTGSEIENEVEKKIRPAVAEVKGVYRFEVSGGQSDHLVITEKDQIMQSIGLMHNELSKVLSEALNVNDLGLASTKEGNFDLNIGTNINQQNALMNYPVAQKNGRIFKLADVASITEEKQESNSFFRINGDNLVNMRFYAEKGVNSISLAEQIKRVMEILEKKLPKGYQLKLQYDHTEFIRKELNKIYFRTCLSVFILLSFTMVITRQVRYLVIIVASLMVNVLLSIIFYYTFNLQIHLYSLAGVTISLGMVIDNSIVIVEEIRYTGQNRIFRAIFASTLTSLGALSVIFFLDEAQKNNLEDFAIAIIINLLVSLPIAYFFMPAILRKIPVAVQKKQIFRKRKQHLVKFNRLFDRQLNFMIRFRFLFLISFIILFGIPTFLLPVNLSNDKAGSKIYNYTLGSDFYQNNLKPFVDKCLGGVLFLYVNGHEQSGYDQIEDRQNTGLSINVNMPRGSTLQQMNNIILPFEQLLKQHRGQFEIFTTNIFSPTEARIKIAFKTGFQPGYPQKVKRQLEMMANYAGAADFGIYGVGRGFNNSINQDRFNAILSLTGYNYDQLQRIAVQVSDTLKLNPRVKNILISTSDDREQKQYYEYVLQINKQDQLILNGVNQWRVGAALSSAQSNKMLTGYLGTKENDREMEPVVLISHNRTIPSLWETNHAPLNLSDSTYLRLGNISQSKRIRVGESIYRNNQSYQLNILYQFIGPDELNQMVKNSVVEKFEKILPFGYKIFSGNGFNWGAVGNGYIWLILMVFCIIFMISAVLLESLKQAFVIVLMIPFSFIGVLLCFYFLGLQFDEGGYAALLMLAGLVTNASLYIINDVNFYRKTQKNQIGVGNKIFLKAFNAKAMPIIITTVSAILSLLPFMISGQEKGFWFTLSAGTIGGLVFSVVGVYLFLPLCLISKKCSL